jgi:hypothetical protein
MEWLYTRVDGQQHLLAMGEHVRGALLKDGYKAVVAVLPTTDTSCASRRRDASADPAVFQQRSERHVGFITGLGTFGAHDELHLQARGVRTASSAS